MTSQPTSATTTVFPGPKPLPVIGNLLEFGRDPLGVLPRWAQQYGDVFRVRAGIPFVFITNPVDIETVLVDKERVFIKATDKYPQRAFARLVFGNGLLFSEGDFWRRQRRLAAPAFHHQRIAAYGEIMVDYTERMLATWRNGETRNIHEEMMQVTLAIVAKTLFNAEVAGAARDVGAALDTIMHETTARMSMPFHLPLRVPTPGNRRFLKAINRIDAIIYRIAQERRASGTDTGDLLSMLIEAQDDDGSHMSDRQLRDEAVTLFVAGHETTALALSWTWYLLSQHPDVEARLVAEIHDVLGGHAPGVADLPQLRYAEQIIKESMRLYPPVWMVSPRLALRDVTIGGYHMPAGTILAIAPWVIHRDPRFYPDPERFDPDRWLPERSQTLPKYAYLPFSGGPRICIGNSFAMMEAVLLLVAIAQRFRLELLPDQRVVPQPSMSVRPKYGLKMRLIERRA